jgi:aminopeptidase
MGLSFREKLENYADLAVKVGVGLQKGQRLVVRAPVECAELARLVVARAYGAGARLVEVLWADDDVNLSRLKYGDPDSFDDVPEAILDAMDKSTARGDALISIYATDPDLYQGQDPEAVARIQKQMQIRMRPISMRISNREINWCIIGAPVPAWAGKVFPAEEAEAGIARLWDAIFMTCRADLPDPVGAWREHHEILRKTRELLSDKQYQELHFQGPGTDLRVGMPENHIWAGGESKTVSGIPFTANIPTEEVFSLPHLERIEGTVHSTKPLSYAGALIDDFSLTFEAGKVVKVEAAANQEVLQRLVDTDEGSSRLGEVALVPHSSPISHSGLLFYNTLYDENASCHLALGRAYRSCLSGGENMSDQEFMDAGGNDSLTHVDFMIGSAEMDVDGILPDGTREPIMRKGEWAFEI